MRSVAELYFRISPGFDGLYSCMNTVFATAGFGLIKRLSTSCRMVFGAVAACKGNATLTVIGRLMFTSRSTFCANARSENVEYMITGRQHHHKLVATPSPGLVICADFPVPERCLTQKSSPLMPRRRLITLKVDVQPDNAKTGISPTGRWISARGFHPGLRRLQSRSANHTRASECRS